MTSVLPQTKTTVPRDYIEKPEAAVSLSSLSSDGQALCYSADKLTDTPVKQPSRTPFTQDRSLREYSLCLPLSLWGLFSASGSIFMYFPPSFVIAGCRNVSLTLRSVTAKSQISSDITAPICTSINGGSEGTICASVQ